jgi:hypothetical protein
MQHPSNTENLYMQKEHIQYGQDMKCVSLLGVTFCRSVYKFVKLISDLTNVLIKRRITVHNDDNEGKKTTNNAKISKLPHGVIVTGRYRHYECDLFFPSISK